MTTALDLVTRALKVRRVLGSVGTASMQEGVDGLTALNAMLKTWSANKLAVPCILQEQLTIAAGQPSRTIGPGGQLNTTRPTRVANSFIRIDTVDWPVEHISVEEYDSIPDKFTQDIPRVMGYRRSSPLGILYFYPAPADAYALFLNSWQPLQSFSGLSTVYSMPPEYEEGIVYNLARRMASFGGMFTAEDLRIASETYNTIRSVNASPRKPIGTELGYMGGSGGGSIGPIDLGELPW